MNVSRIAASSGVTGAAAQIDDALRMIKWHLRQQIAWRACSLVFELEVLLGAPVFGCSVIAGGIRHLRIVFL